MVRSAHPERGRALLVSGAALLLMGTTSCGSAARPTAAAAAAAAAPEASAAAGDGTSTRYESGRPPPVRLDVDGAQRQLPLWSWCGLQAGCADSAPPREPPSIGGPASITASYPYPGWTFRASFRASGHSCAREQVVDLRRDEATGSSTLLPAGPTGTYDVLLYGESQPDTEGSRDSVATAFRWTTPTDGPPATPEASVTALWATGGDHPRGLVGPVTSTGVDLDLVNLARSPAAASAVMTFTSAEGRSLTVPLAGATEECAPEGTVRFRSSAQDGSEAASLGSAPFTYDVEVTLDGVEHRSTATWPGDESPSGAVPLRFDPPLPALQVGPTG